MSNHALWLKQINFRLKVNLKRKKKRSWERVTVCSVVEEVIANFIQYSLSIICTHTHTITEMRIMSSEISKQMRLRVI